MPASPSPATVRTTVPDRVRTSVLTIAVPLAIQVAAMVVVWSWRSDLPDPIATHWGPDGPDGFQPLTIGTLLIAGAVALGLSLIFWAIGFFWGQVASTRRVAAGVAVGMSVFLAGMWLLALYAQRGLDDAAQAGDIDAAIALSCAAALVTGALIAWLLVPGDAARDAASPVPADAARVDVPAGERAAWFARVSGGPGLWIVGGATVALTVVAVATQQLWMLIIPAAIGLLSVTMFVWEVRVDAAGLDVRSAAGWPRTHVPASSVESATARNVRPVREFGGYGWRTAVGGTVGIIVRGGEALEVVHSGGKKLVVTVDDAAAGAALLNTMADRSR